MTTYRDGHAAFMRHSHELADYMLDLHRPSVLHVDQHARVV